MKGCACGLRPFSVFGKPCCRAGFLFGKLFEPMERDKLLINNVVYKRKGKLVNNVYFLC